MYNLKPFAITMPYTLGITNYAKLFETYKHTFDGLTSSSGKEIKFSLYQVSEQSYIKKDYILSNSVNEVLTVWDMTPYETGIDLKYTLENDLYTFYVKGSLEQPINMIINSCDSIGSFKPILFSNFDTDISTLNILETKIYKKEIDVNFKNNWKNHSGESTKLYVVDGKRIIIDVAIMNGDYSDETVVLSIDEKYAPHKNKYLQLIGYDGNTLSIAGLGRLNTSGELQVFGLSKQYSILYASIEYSY